MINKEELTGRIREGLIKDYNKLYVKEYTTTWREERIVRKVEIDIMSFENTIESIISLLSKEEEVIRKEGVKWVYDYMRKSKRITDYNLDRVYQFLKESNNQQGE